LNFWENLLQITGPIAKGGVENGIKQIKKKRGNAKGGQSPLGMGEQKNSQNETKNFN